MPVIKKAEKRDILTPIAIGIGTVGLGLGAYLFLKKPPGASPGDTVRAHFNFKYSGPGGDYILLVRFGYHRSVLGVDWFDPEEGMDRYTLLVSLPPPIYLEPSVYEYSIDCVIPDAAPKRSYDAEGSILTPQMEPGQDWILRVFKDKAINVR